LLTDDIILELVIENDIATLQIEERPRFRRPARVLSRHQLAAGVHGYACWLIDSVFR